MEPNNVDSPTMGHFLKDLVGLRDFQQRSWDADTTARVFHGAVNNFLNNVVDRPDLQQVFEAALATACCDVLISDVRAKASFPGVKWQAIATLQEPDIALGHSIDTWVESVLWESLVFGYGEKAILRALLTLLANGDLRSDCVDDNGCYPWSYSECEYCLKALCTEL